jgi:hydrogenase maturation protease
VTARPDDPLIIGVGSRSRGDDAIGPRVVDELSTRQPALRTMVCEGDLADLALRWGSADDVVVIDACCTGQPVGTIHWLEPEQLRSQSPWSTHGVGIAEAVELARLLDRLPRSLQVIGIEARTFDYGPMPAELENAIPSIVDELLTEVLMMRSPASDRRS